MMNRGGIGRMAAWHLPGGPVGPPGRWVATSNVYGRREWNEGGCPGTLSYRERGLYLYQSSAGASILIGSVAYT